MADRGGTLMHPWSPAQFCSALDGAWSDCAQGRRWKIFATLSPGVILFVVAMALGMLLEAAWQRRAP